MTNGEHQLRSALMNLQESAEMYLKTILMLEKKLGKVRAIDIARQMQFSRPTVSQQMKRLSQNGLIEIDQQKHIHLTPQGQKIAEKTYKRYNSLAESFVWMGVDEDIAFQDACRIEHYISQETFEALVNYYNYCREVRKDADPKPDQDSSKS